MKLGKNQKKTQGKYFNDFFMDMNPKAQKKAEKDIWD